MRHSPLYEVRMSSSISVVLNARTPGCRANWHVGNPRERHPSIRFGTGFGSACSVGQWDEWVDPNFALQHTDPIVVGLLLIFTLCAPSLARERLRKLMRRQPGSCSSPWRRCCSAQRHHPTLTCPYSPATFMDSSLV